MERRKALILEDNEMDAELVKVKLKREGFDFDYKVVELKKDFELALKEFQPEIIFSDYNLPDFNGIYALKIARKKFAFTPFIFISGTLGEERAVEAVKNGASDFVLKDNLARLAIVVRRALDESEAIKEKHILEHKLKQLNEKLEHKVERRTLELKGVNRELVQANKELEAFSYTVSHDLRIPLAAIEMFANLVEEKSIQGNAQACTEYARNTQKCLKEMSMLIQDLLAYSLMGKREKLLERFDIKELFNEVFSEVRVTTDHPLIMFQVDDLPDALGDKNMLKHAVTNLLGNAVKFAKSRAQIDIHVTGKVVKGETIYAVQDNGIGFKPENAEQIFKVFERLHKREDYEGSGAGLAIVERVISRHGGRVWAEGREGKGAKFYFSLPNGK